MGVFILGVSIPDTQIVAKALQSFFGVGPNVAARLMAKHSIHNTAMVSSLAHAKVTAITEDLSKMKIENELKREILENIRRLRDMGAYRGRRHAMSLPVRGQNTRSQIKSAQRLNRIERRL